MNYSFVERVLRRSTPKQTRFHMPTILITWELGGGLGHLHPVAALANAIASRGHHVVAALRTSDSQRVRFPEGTVILQSPLGDTESPLVRFPSCLAELLLNVGFADSNELQNRVAQWYAIFEDYRPDFIVCDHSPTAQLAALCSRVPIVRSGIGFCCPPNEDADTRNLRPWRHVPPADVAAAECRVLNNANRVLQHYHAPLLDRFSEIFTKVDQTFLMTLPELDHFPSRSNARYWGPAPFPCAGVPSWPANDRPRILAYLKPFPALESVLERLRNVLWSTLVLGAGIPNRIKSLFTSDTLCFAERDVDIAQAARDCDLTITHAGHGVTAASLLAGKPVVMIPIVLEQAILAKRVIESGVGIWAYPHKPAQIISAIECVAKNPVYRRRAQEFASRYRDFNAHQSMQQVADSIENRLHTKPP
jgi:UDP:flavonoid glycosyltransferase YjiC (YdhE family)